MISVILHVEPAARRHRDDVFDKGDGVGLLELRPNQERVVVQFLSGKLEATDSPFRSPRLVSLALSACSSLRRFHEHTELYRGEPWQGTRCQRSPEISRLLLG